MVKYKILWEALKDTAEVMIEDGIVGEVSWYTLLEIMRHGEKLFEPEKRSSARTFLTVFVDALEFGFACLSGFFEHDSIKYATWSNGKTSKTADGTSDFMVWRFCELVEEEDDGK